MSPSYHREHVTNHSFEIVYHSEIDGYRNTLKKKEPQQQKT